MKKSILITSFTFIFSASLLCIFSSCEKNIVVEIPDPIEKVVVEGWIEPDSVAYVMLSRNTNFFSKMDKDILVDLQITDAIITISDGVNTEQLADTTYYGFFHMYKGKKIKGEVGKTYTIKIEALGKVLTASTSIPKPLKQDSVWFKTEPGKDSLGYLWAIISDPADEKNYYRLSTMRIGKDIRFVPNLVSVYEDKFFNGQTLTFSMRRGFESNFSNTQDPEATYFKIGDTIVLRSATITRTTFEFWRAAEAEIYASGNPFASPTSIPTNIEGGGLGIWSGYGTTYDTIVAKKH